MGTYRLKAKAVIQNSPTGGGYWVVRDNDGAVISSADVDIVNNILNPIGNFISVEFVTAGPIDIILKFSFDEDEIILDGGSPITYAGLPPGFTPTSEVVHLGNVFGIVGKLSTAWKLLFDLSNVSPGLTYPTGPWAGPPNPLSGEPNADLSFSRDFTITPPSMFTLLSNGFGVFGDNVFIFDDDYILFNDIYVDGTYVISGFSWTIANTGPVAPGDTITINSPGGVNPDLTTVTDITLEYTDEDNVLRQVIVSSADFVIWTASMITFILPLDPFNRFVGDLTLNGVLFSGTVLIGTMSVIIADASGIYTLVQGKVSDTLYVDSPNTDTTAEIKIPNPFIKTGFIGG